jgi:hypothetical protein
MVVLGVEEHSVLQSLDVLAASLEHHGVASEITCIRSAKVATNIFTSTVGVANISDMQLA